MMTTVGAETAAGSAALERPMALDRRGWSTLDRADKSATPKHTGGTWFVAVALWAVVVVAIIVYRTADRLAFCSSCSRSVRCVATFC